jgi:hypothetical protein
MSDIAIRFDGLILAGSFAVWASIYFLVALSAAIVGLRTNRERLLLVARTASLFGVLSLVALGLVVAYMARFGPPTAGPDWLDWLTLPSLVLFAAGCVVIARRKPGSRHPV